MWPLIARVALRHLPAALGKSAAAMSRRWRPRRIGSSALPMLRKAADEAKIFMRDALKMAQPVLQI